MRTLVITLVAIQISILIAGRYKDILPIHLVGVILTLSIMSFYLITIVKKGKIKLELKSKLASILLIWLLFYINSYSSLLIGKPHIIIYLLHFATLLFISSDNLPTQNSTTKD